MRFLLFLLLPSFILANGTIGTSSGTQMIMTAFTFGSASIVFATAPFLFVIIRGLIKANSGHNQHSSSVISVFSLAFIVHFVSCIGFMVAIKLMDTLRSIHGKNYLEDKIFGIFWARGEDAVFSLSGASGSIEDKGAYLQLFLVQGVFDWGILFVYGFIFFCATAYGTLQAKKDNLQADIMQIFIWILIANIVGFFAFYLWAKIATLALFIPNDDVISMIHTAYKNIVEN